MTERPIYFRQPSADAMVRAMTDRFTYGPVRVFVPICIRHPSWGFIGGPGGYEERSIEHVDDAPIVVDAE